ncbi:salicylate synthase [Nocardiopsis ganjiahuensis]|uniref:salicylate synthase n=1 Tax=Nocardiopsis ganjiahuensis TaxID=239984 RepID=UPI0004755E0C|nr:salicylate synthase [Nocardiopsis ganjiahuensis]
MGRFEYTSALVITGDNPDELMTRLVQTVATEDYVLYENPPLWSLAVGRIAEVVLTPTHAIYRDAEGEHVVPREEQLLAEVPRLLERVPVDDWRAYGIAGFDLPHTTATQAGEFSDDEPLLHLMVPRLEVSITDGTATVRGVDTAEVEAVAGAVQRTEPRQHPNPSPVDVSQDEGNAYQKAVEEVQARMRSEGLQKVVLSRAVPIGADVDVPATFLLGRRHNTPARSFMVRINGSEAAGFSPEIIVNVSADRQVTTQPLAGTRPYRAHDAEHSARLRQELLDDPKEVCEHALAVRNSLRDMAACCEPDSPAVKDFMTVENRGSVQHIASRVIGTLDQRLSPWDALISLFPTLIGAPRPQAHAMIREFETTPRGLYGGAVLVADASGSLDAALVIRSLFQEQGRAWLQAGAGIGLESRPDREFEETCEKMRSVSSHIVLASKADRRS